MCVFYAQFFYAGKKILKNANFELAANNENFVRRKFSVRSIGKLDIIIASIVNSMPVKCR